jgi:hypothetical protein
MPDPCYISLGSDCSVSWNLRQLGLQNYGTMPFDWMRIDKLQDVITVLEDGFNEFASFESYTIKGQSLAFDYFDFDSEDCASIKSQYRMVHSKYKFILPHEYQGSLIDSREFQKKYSRRIVRFLEIGRNSALRKIFIRLGTVKELELIGKLHAVLETLDIVNYEIKHIFVEEWEDSIPKNEPFRWQRDYIPWEKILIHPLNREYLIQ